MEVAVSVAKDVSSYTARVLILQASKLVWRIHTFKYTACVKHLRVWRRQTTSKRRGPSLVARGQSNLRACRLLMFQIDSQIDKRLVHKLVWPRVRLAPRVFYT